MWKADDGGAERLQWWGWKLEASWEATAVIAGSHLLEAKVKMKMKVRSAEGKPSLILPTETSLGLLAALDTSTTFSAAVPALFSLPLSFAPPESDSTSARRSRLLSGSSVQIPPLLQLPLLASDLASLCGVTTN